jgi:putative membrane protein
MMLADHKKMDVDVKKLITKKNWQVPAIGDTANAVNINDKTGKDWDKAWTDKMVQAHQDLLNNLQQQQNQVKDADLKATITKAIPVVQGHLKMADMLNGKM